MYYPDKHLGVNIADGIFDAKVKISPSSVNNTLALDWVAVVMNLTTNLLATILIVYRAW